MRFEWDPEKARSNLRKHGVSFEDATLVWRDPSHRIEVDEVVNGEVRLKALGFVGAEQLLLVVHVDVDDDAVRIISARPATRHERRAHEG